MATQAQIDAKATTALVAKEIDRVREILDFDGTGDATLEADMQERLTALVDVQRQRLRAYIDDWDAISAAPVSTSGEKQYSTDKHQMQVRNRLRVLLGYSPLRGAGSGGLRRIGMVGEDGYACPVYEDLP